MSDDPRLDMFHGAEKALKVARDAALVKIPKRPNTSETLSIEDATAAFYADLGKSQ